MKKYSFLGLVFILLEEGDVKRGWSGRRGSWCVGLIVSVFTRKFGS